MRVQTIARKLVVKLCLSVILLLTPVIASAEYYFWYPEPVVNIVEYHGSRHHHYWSVEHGYYYDDCMVFPAFDYYPVRRVHHYAAPRHHPVIRHHRAIRHHRRGCAVEVYSYRCYDPDLATSDDNPCVNPNMDIDY